MTKSRNRRTGPAEKDLFGSVEKKRPGRIENLLAKFDRNTFDERIKRLKYLESIAPKGYGMVAGIETIAVFHEARLTFISGAFAATIMLSQAFIEHWLQALLGNNGFENAAKRGLKSIIKCCRDNHLLNDYLLGKIDHLRQTRNPFSHLKPTAHPFTLSQRLFLEKKQPNEILEKEAKDALGLMYTISGVRL